MTVRTDWLGDVTSVASTLHTLYTVPAGYRTIVKELAVTGDGSTSGAYVWFVDKGAGVLRPIGRGPITVGTDDVRMRWCVLREGWSLVVFVSIAGVACYASGTELVLTGGEV